jgi:hypothetical protein
MKTIVLLPFLALTFLAAAAAEKPGTIEGRVVLSEQPPPESRIDLEAHPRIAALHPDGLTTRRYRVGKDGSLRNVLVYLKLTFWRKFLGSFRHK